LIRATLLNTIRDSIWYGAATLAARLAPIVLLPFYVRWFPPEGLGAIQGITAFAYFWYVVMALQICSVSMRFYHEYKTKSEQEKLVGTLLCILLVSIVLLGSGACLYSSFLSRYLFGQTGYKLTIILATLSTCIWVINDYFFTLLRLEKETRKYLAINLVQFISNVLLNYLCIRTLSLGLNGAFWALLFSQFLSACLLVWRGNVLRKLQFSPLIFKRVISYVSPLMIVPILEWFRNYYYQIYALKHFGEAELGSISIAIRIVQIFILIDAGLNLAWTPVAMSVIDNPRGKELYRYYYRYSFVLYVLCFLILSLFSKEGIFLFASDEYRNSFRYVPILFLLAFSRALLWHYNGIWIAERTAYITFAYGLGALTSVISIHLLGFMFHQYGVLLGAVIGSLVISYVVFVYSERFYHVGYSIKSVWYFLLFASLVIVYNLKIASSVITPIELSSKILFTLILSIAIYYLWLDKRERTEIKTLVSQFFVRFKIA